MTAFEQLELPFPEPEAITAFLVIVNPDGSAVATSDMSKAPPVQRQASLADMRRACYEINADIAASQAADNLITRMAEAQRTVTQAEKISAKLEERSAV